MGSIEQLLELQNETGDNIQKIIRNYKKDSADRKKESAYFEEREQRLQELWDQFQATDSSIRDVCKEPMQLEYFSKSYYDKIKAITLEHIKVFRDETDRIRQQAREQTRTTDKKTPATAEIPQQDFAQAGRSADNTSGIIRRLNARLTALSRLINGLSVTEPNPLQYFELQIATIKRLWDQIELLHDEAYDQLSNPVDYGLNQDEYDRVYDLVQRNLVSLSISADKLKQNAASTSNEVAGSVAKGSKSSSLHLPKITIP